MAQDNAQVSRDAALELKIKGNDARWKKHDEVVRKGDLCKNPICPCKKEARSPP